MFSFCPKCKVYDLKYKPEDTVLVNMRDGMGLFIKHVICKNCNYPLAGCFDKPQSSELENDVKEYYASIITDYQNGFYEEKNVLLSKVMENNNFRILDYHNQIEKLKEINKKCLENLD